MIILIGNGQSKSVTNLDLFKNHTTYGCDSIYRKFMPNYLICQDMNVQLELITNNLTKKHKCYFKGFDLIPSMHYAMLKQSVDKKLKIGENRPPTDNFIQFAHEGVMYFIWIDSTDLTENVEWWDDEWISDTVALRIACQHNPNETFYCVGYDYYHDQTSTGIYLGSNGSSGGGFGGVLSLGHQPFLSSSKYCSYVVSFCSGPNLKFSSRSQTEVPVLLYPSFAVFII